MSRRSRETPQSSPRRWRTARSLGFTVLIVLVFRAFIAEAYVIPSESMQSNLLVGDRLFANKAVYGLRVPFTTFKLSKGRMPRHGEVVLFVHPRDGKTLVKRVIGLGGDTVTLRGHQLWVNGKPLAREPINASCTTTLAQQEILQTVDCDAHWERAHPGDVAAPRYRVLQLRGAPREDFGPYRVPPGSVFVMGDNRDFSSDSRAWGVVPRSHLMGRAMFIYFSRGRDGIRWSRLLSAVK